MRITNTFTRVLMVLAMAAAFSTGTAFAHSDIQAMLSDNTIAVNSAALVIGNGSRANIGGIFIEGSKVIGKTTAATTWITSAALGIGSGTNANIGGVSVQSSAFNGFASSRTTSVNS